MTKRKEGEDKHGEPSRTLEKAPRFQLGRDKMVIKENKGVSKDDLEEADRLRKRIAHDELREEPDILDAIEREFETKEWKIDAARDHLRTLREAPEKGSSAAYEILELKRLLLDKEILPEEIEEGFTIEEFFALKKTALKENAKMYLRKALELKKLGRFDPLSLEGSLLKSSLQDAMSAGSTLEEIEPGLTVEKIQADFGIKDFKRSMQKPSLLGRIVDQTLGKIVDRLSRLKRK